MKLALITDSSAAISKKYKKFDNLHILDIPLTIDGVTYSSKEIFLDDFFDLMATSKDVPKSSQPSVMELEGLLKRLKVQGYTHVLGLFLPSAISGFYQNAYYLQNEYSDENMKVVFPETFITSSPLGYMVETALEAEVKNLDFDTVIANFERLRDNDSAFMLVDDLKWLSKSGRLSNSAAVLGTLFGIKPVLTFSDAGSVELFEKVRTTKKAMSRMKKLLLEHSKPDDYKIYIIHSRAERKAKELYEFAVAQGYKDVEILSFGAVIATHLGIGATAYAMVPKIF
ncbi:DegV family protein [Lactovum miscens]|uniref:DegV family protein with EDD domain n=1 Tax=Lactovum miscens TaxID=190387 RepID=A0A841C8Q0_9LACT|nr:DegV family protein [Lactovum miscens]MBB5887931.1 DegV family protein with EDD domain [Lactovum miscens]